MRIIDTRIETMQIELLEASKEITTDEECMGFLLFDFLKGRLYLNPEDAFSNKGGLMLRESMVDNCNLDCDGSTFLRVSIVVDAFKRDKGESRFSICDKDEVNDALTNHRKIKEQEANKEDDGFTMIEGMPFKADKVVYYNAKTGKPDSYRTVIALTDNGFWFAGRYQEDVWKFKDGGVFDPESAGGEVVAWFEVPTLHKLQ